MKVKRISSVSACLILITLGLIACNPGSSSPSPLPEISTPSPNPETLFPLSIPGKYNFGTRQNFEFPDPASPDRTIRLSAWYPAILPADAPPSEYNFDAEPDRSGAPYPLIISSSKVGSIFGPHLASHGFVVVGVNSMDSNPNWGKWLIIHPKDLLFALDQAANEKLAGLEGMIDGDHAGAMGYSFDGYNALALSGARVDPEFYQSKCADPSKLDPAPPDWWIKYNCNMDVTWDEFTKLAGKETTASDDGLWQPRTDDRILAVMPMAPEGAWLFGERGLAAVDRPTLIIAAGADEVNIYDLEAVYIYEHLGVKDKRMITFIGEEHGMIESDLPVVEMKHFAAAFFGFYLQGNESYKEYFSEEFVTGRENLAWGVYPAK